MEISQTWIEIFINPNWQKKSLKYRNLSIAENRLKPLNFDKVFSVLNDPCQGRETPFQWTGGMTGHSTPLTPKVKDYPTHTKTLFTSTVEMGVFGTLHYECAKLMLQSCNVVKSQCCKVATQSHNVAKLQCSKVAMLQSCNAAKLQSCNVVMLQCCKVVMLQYCKVAKL